MNPHDLLQTYLTRLGKGDVAGVLELFAPGALVHSPVYGDVPAQAFYPQLAADTRQSTLRYLRTYQDPADPYQVALYFRYAWELADGTLREFPCVDLFQMDDHGRIQDLVIIYDTGPFRANT